MSASQGTNTIPTRTVEDFFDHEYRAYAMYTISSRAIPSVIDGLKPAQRKIAFAANKLWKTGDEKPMKVFQLGGQAAALSFFHHGSLDQTIVNMTQDFKNSLPIFQGDGQFGSLRSPDAGATRYIGVRFNENFRSLYRDFDLVTPQFEDGVEIEPAFYLPIVPTILLNGGSGIAVGFATNILNRHPVPVIDACLDVLEASEAPEILKPWIRGFYGEVSAVPDSQGRTWTFHGVFDVKNTTTVEITEIPPGFTYEKYEAVLDGLVEKGVVVSYDDASSDRVRYTLKFARQVLADLQSKNRLGDTLKMRETETENLTTLDEHGQLKVFNHAGELITYFVHFRLGYYEKRKQRLREDLRREIAVLRDKVQFIAAIIAGTLSVANVARDDIIAACKTHGIGEHDGGFDYLLSMPVYALTRERYDKLLAQISNAETELVRVEKTTPTEFYLSDLYDLRAKIADKSDKRTRKKVATPSLSLQDVCDVLSMFG